jgi:uracil-DNA glycosylase
LSASEQPLVFLLWGAQASGKLSLFLDSERGRHCVLLANHPSPLSARRGPTPFIGCGHFRAAAEFLARNDPGRAPIDWSV